MNKWCYAGTPKLLVSPCDVSKNGQLSPQNWLQTCCVEKPVGDQAGEGDRGGLWTSAWENDMLGK